jgi:hypothetical protein
VVLTVHMPRRGQDDRKLRETWGVWQKRFWIRVRSETANAKALPAARCRRSTPDELCRSLIGFAERTQSVTRQVSPASPVARCALIGA